MRGTLLRLEVEHLPRPPKAPEPLWLWWWGPSPPMLAVVWQVYVARLSIEHTFRFFKQTLKWTPKLRRPEATACLWPPIQAAFAYVHRAAQVLAHPTAAAGARVREAYQALLAEWQVQPASRLGPLAPAVAPFRTVTASYSPALFHGDDLAELPRPNNDLEHYCGTARHLQRRATGRQAASPALVVRGAVRVVAAVATRLETVAPMDAAALRAQGVAAWWALRPQVEARHRPRRAQAGFTALAATAT